MTKEGLLRKNGQLKDRIIELQSEVIRLKTIQKNWNQYDVYPPYLKYPYSDTGDPLPPQPITICGTEV